MRWSRALIIVGLAAMVIAVVDPLEGSVVVLAGTALAAVGSRLGHHRQPHLLYASVVFVAVGVTALWWMSALGGFGGKTGRSNGWALVLMPYPIGWVIGIAGAVRILRERVGTAP